MSQLNRQIEAWDRLANQAVEPNCFFESWFLRPSLRELADPEAVDVLCFTQSDVLRGLLPIIRSRNYYDHPVPHLATWRHANILLGTPLVATGAEEQFWRALVAWADANAGLALFFHLNAIALGGPLYRALEAVLEQENRQWAVVDKGERALLASQLEPDEYRAKAFSKHRRRDLRRRLARLGELGDVAFSWEDGEEGLEQWCDDFLRIEASGWKGEAGSALACDPATETLFWDSLAGAARRGRLVRLSLNLDGKPIAMLASFVAPPGSFGFKTAYDETFSAYSPGVLVEQEYISLLRDRSIEWSDSCAAPDHPVMNDIWLERRSIGSVSIAIGGPLRRFAFRQLLRFESSYRVKDFRNDHL